MKPPIQVGVPGQEFYNLAASIAAQKAVLRPSQGTASRIAFSRAVADLLISRKSVTFSGDGAASVEEKLRELFSVRCICRCLNIKDPAIMDTVVSEYALYRVNVCSGQISQEIAEATFDNSLLSLLERSKA
jgi:hypothetical protein